MRAHVFFASFLAVIVLWQAGAGNASGSLILNEWNAVGSEEYLAGGSYKVDPTREDAYWGSFAGMPNGRIEGNGGNWIELVVVEDHVDIRGWQMRWKETGANATNGTDIWAGDGAVEQGIITFSPSAAIWSDLRSGTIITVSEKDFVYVDTDWDTEGDDRNFTDGLDSGDAEVDVTINLRTDVRYNPILGDGGADWWIHVSSRDELGKASPTLTTVTNVVGDGAGDFSVGPDDWEMSIFDDLGALVFGPIGEAITTFGDFPGGLNDEEAGRLEADPALGITNSDYDDVTTTSFGAPNEWGGNVQDFESLRIPEPMTVLLLGMGGALVLRRRDCRA